MITVNTRYDMLSPMYHVRSNLPFPFLTTSVRVQPAAPTMGVHSIFYITSSGLTLEMRCVVDMRLQLRVFFPILSGKASRIVNYIVYFSQILAI
jgi:hypothetical protein